MQALNRLLVMLIVVTAPQALARAQVLTTAPQTTAPQQTTPPIASSQSTPSSAIAMHGAPALAEGFAALPYVNPDAPKGGQITLGSLRSFDSLNPLIVRGEPVQGMREFVFESLMARNQDEPFSLYALIAQTIAVSPDKRTVTFQLNPAAKFSDDTPIKPADVIFSFEVLRDRGRPNYRTYFKKVSRAEQIGDAAVRFTLSEDDRELPLILGVMPVLPSHLLTAETFEQTTLQPLIGSGPYTVGDISPGRSITYQRNPNYWARNLPINRGRYNFAQIRFEYYRDANALFEAFKAGAIDVRLEDDPALWAQGYTFPAATDGRVRKEEISLGIPAGMTAFVFNTRRKIFTDPRVRRAITLLFNFEWINRSLYNGVYKRTQSFFERSTLSSSGRPASDAERRLLAPFPTSVRPEILEGTFTLPMSDGTGHNRANAKLAIELLASAGYTLDKGIMVETATKKPLQFEMLAASAGQERLMAAFANDLARIGVVTRTRVIDSAQYQARLKDYDYDLIQFTYPSSLSPGNEQLFRWSTKVADKPGSYNYAGVRNPAVDAMIGALLRAEARPEFEDAVHALDRVLLSGDYVLPLFHAPKQWVGYWRHLENPANNPLFGFSIDTWWMKQDATKLKP